MAKKPKKPAVSLSDTAQPPELSVVVPVLNEAGNIAPLVEGLMETFANRTIEIIYVNDASTDATALELAQMQKTVKALRVLTHSNRSGQSAALRSGILAAKAPLIATLDGDGQNPPQDLLALEAALLAHRSESGGELGGEMGGGHVMAAGYRVRRQDGAAKRYASLAARKVRRWLLQDQHPDTGCATKVFDRSLYLRLPYFDHMHRFMAPLARREGAVVLACPVSHAPRTQGQSKYKTLDRLMVGISDILGVMWLLRRSPKRFTVKEDVL